MLKKEKEEEEAGEEEGKEEEEEGLQILPRNLSKLWIGKLLEYC